MVRWAACAAPLDAVGARVVIEKVDVRGLCARLKVIRHTICTDVDPECDTSGRQTAAASFGMAVLAVAAVASSAVVMMASATWSVGEAAGASSTMQDGPRSTEVAARQKTGRAGRWWR